MSNLFEQTKYQIKQSQFQQIVKIMNDFDKTQQFINQPIIFINCTEITKMQLRELNEQEFKNTVALMNNFDKTEQFKRLPIEYINCVEIVEVDNDDDFEYEEEVEEEDEEDDDENENDDDEDDDEQSEEEEIISYIDTMNNLKLLNDGINYKKATLEEVLLDAEILKDILGFERNKQIRGLNYRNPDNSIKYINNDNGKLDLNYLLFMYVDNFNHITLFRKERNEIKQLSYKICEKIRRFLYKHNC
jgi:hypothetical protein